MVVAFAIARSTNPGKTPNFRPFIILRIEIKKALKYATRSSSDAFDAEAASAFLTIFPIPVNFRFDKIAERSRKNARMIVSLHKEKNSPFK